MVHAGIPFAQQVRPPEGAWVGRETLKAVAHEVDEGGGHGGKVAVGGDAGGDGSSVKAGFEIEPIGQTYFEKAPKWAGWMEWG